MSFEEAQATPVTDLSAVMEPVEALKKSLEEQRIQQVAVLQQEKSVSSQPPVSESGKSCVQLV